MNEKVLRTLEYHKIIEELANLAGSEPGKELCRALLPTDNPVRIERAQQETAQALFRIIKKGAPSFSGNRDFGSSLARLRVEAALSSAELLQLASILECAKRTIAYGKSSDSREFADDTAAGRSLIDDDVASGEDAPQGDHIDSLIARLDALVPLTNEIRRCIIEEDLIADDASPELKKIRKEQSTVNGRIHTQLTSMVNGSLRTCLQDAVITMRGDRYCLPVKAEYKSKVPGMVHDQSSTGSTFFIEPQAVVSLNNRLKELAAQEKTEIANILRDLSLEASAHVQAIGEDVKVLKILDHIFARGLLALKYNGVKPIYDSSRKKKVINIRRGRHPLIDPKKVVPTDIHLGDDFDLLIITGPNTGGKTVALKTLGLFVLMGQAGLHIPAGDRSELAIFREVYADIGDEQSIEQNLSTFSSHMTNIVSILEKADSKSLCLFDEPGAGTDPTEGAALAMAILDSLHMKGIRTMATTHYSEIKLYALQTEGVENACCEFDVESLKPTYRLLIGIPGKSNAFAISRRLGLSDEIIENAKSRVSKESESFEDVLTRLEEDRITMERDRLEIESYKAEIESLKEKTRNYREKTEASRDKIIRKANEEAALILKEAKELADETIRTFNKAGQGTSIKELEKQRAKVGGELSKKQKRSSEGGGALKSLQRLVDDPSKLKKGDLVRIISMGLKGTVAELPDRKGNVKVRCGIITSTVSYKDLELLPDDDAAAAKDFGSEGGGSGKGSFGQGAFGSPKSGSGNAGGMSKSLSVSTEINLLGKTVDEAIYQLDKYLDDAYLARFSQVRVVHGKGTGALRTAVHNHLRRMKTVADYRLGEFGEGDAGVTIVTFK